MNREDIEKMVISSTLELLEKDLKTRCVTEEYADCMLDICTGDDVFTPGYKAKLREKYHKAIEYRTGENARIVGARKVYGYKKILRKLEKTLPKNSRTLRQYM